jgi:hypothetical protein
MLDVHDCRRTGGTVCVINLRVLREAWARARARHDLREPTFTDEEVELLQAPWSYLSPPIEETDAD